MSVVKTGGAEEEDQQIIESDGVVLLPIGGASVGETGGKQEGILLPRLCTRWEFPNCEGGGRPVVGDRALRRQASEHLLVSRAE